MQIFLGRIFGVKRMLIGLRATHAILRPAAAGLRRVRQDIKVESDAWGQEHRFQLWGS